jgi:hypothetical protein
MYLILAAALAGIAYLAYETFAAKYFTKPVVKRNARSVQGSGEKVVVATDGKGQGGYPASARTVKKGTTSDGEGVVSGGEITSGGEGGKKTAGKSKGKGKK